MDIKAMAKLAGVSEDELKGKTLGDQIKLITKKMNDEKDSIETENAKIYISNYEKQIPKLRDFLQKPIEIYVRSVGQRKTPTSVPVVGYNGLTKEFVVCYNEKLYSLKDSETLKTFDEFMNLLNTKKAKGTGKKKTK